MKGLSGWKNKLLSMKLWKVPRFKRVNHVWQSRPWRHTGREDLDSVVSMEDWRRNQTEIRSTSKAERLIGMKLSEIHVQREVRIESALDEDQISAL